MTDESAAGPTDGATSGSASVRIAATPEAVFAALTDLDVLPSCSPENQRCEFLGGATEMALGATFRGHNQAGDYQWHADCIVTEFVPGRSFAYEVPPDFDLATTWRYTIEPDGDGCVVTETFDAPLLSRPDVYPGRIEGRRDNLEKACGITMSNLKTILEA